MTHSIANKRRSSNRPNARRAEGLEQRCLLALPAYQSNTHWGALTAGNADVDAADGLLRYWKSEEELASLLWDEAGAPRTEVLALFRGAVDAEFEDDFVVDLFEMVVDLERSGVSRRMIARLVLREVWSSKPAMTPAAMMGVVGDTGTADTLSLTVDWGDGTQSVLYPNPGTPQPFSASHAYDDDGTYNATVTASNEDGASISRNSGGTLLGGVVTREPAASGNRHRYDLVTLDEATGSAAEAEELWGYLATIASAEEQQFLNDAFLFADPDGDSWQEGLYRAYWIGLSDRNSEGSFEWGAGEPVTYENWNIGEPDIFCPEGEDYASMYCHYMMSGFQSEPGQWDDVTDVGAGCMPIQWVINEFGAAPTLLSISVSNIVPEAAIAGSSTGLRGQPQQFAARVSDPGVLDTYTSAWQVLSGTTVVASGAAALAEFTPVETGLYTVRLERAGRRRRRRR